MEVGDQGIDGGASGRWVDEDVGLRLNRAGGRDASFGGRLCAADGVLDRTHGGGADGDAGAGLAFSEFGEGGGGDFIPLVVDVVLLDVVDLDGVEGADADLQGEVVKRRTFRFECGDQVGCKVEAGGGGGNGHALLVIGVDGLVAVVVVRPAGVIHLAFDIGGQRHDPEALGEIGDGLVAHGFEADTVVAVAAGFEDGGGVFAVDAEAAGMQCFLAGLEQAPPGDGVFRRLQEEAFDFSSRGALAEQAGLEDGCVVPEVACVCREEVADLGEMAVGDGACFSIHDHEFRGIAPGSGFLGDTFCRKVVIKESAIHFASCIYIHAGGVNSFLVRSFPACAGSENRAK